MKRNLLLLLLSVMSVGVFSQATHNLYYGDRSTTSNAYVNLLVSPPVVSNFSYTGLSKPYGLAIDTVNNKLFTTDAAMYAIYKSDLDGSNFQMLLDSNNCTLLKKPHEPYGIIVLNNKIYWCAYEGIYSANLDGTNPQVAWDFTTAGPELPLEMAFNPGDNSIYLVNDKYDYSGGLYKLANTPGTTTLSLVIPLVDGTAIALDTKNGKIYFAAYGVTGSQVTIDGIYQSDINGTNITKIGNFGSKATWGMAVDMMENNIFWGFKASSAGADGKIIKANLDGTGQVDYLTGINPNGMVLDIYRNPTGIVNSSDKTAVSLYPNPASSVLNIRISGQAMVSILSTTGSNLMNTPVNNTATIDLSGFAAGLYLLQVKTETGIETFKFSVAR